MATQDWANRPYLFDAVNGSGSSCGGKAFSSPNVVACAVRKTSGAASTSIPPYTTWAFGIDTNGVIQALGTNPPTVTGL